MPDKPSRLLPQLTPENEHFWCGGADGELRLLRCRPGKRVGSALHFLGQLIAEDPTLNEPETLRARLVDWSTRSPE